MSLLDKLSDFYFPVLRFTDIIEIFIMMFLIYNIIVRLKNTRVMVLLKGILVLFVCYMTAYIASFEAILVIFKSGIAICVVAVIVVFQPEMRKFLEQIGTKKVTIKGFFLSLFNKKEEVQTYYSDKTIEELTKGCFAMGETKTGALIVIERDIPLNEYIETGIPLNADLTSQLLINVFEKNTPLHDGAVVMIGNKIISATCYLPLSSSTKISKHMGTRHRAAIGVSEVSDCIVLIVSEETGRVSLTENGVIQSSLTPEKLSMLLKKYQLNETKGVTVSKNTFKDVKKKILNKRNLDFKIISIMLGFFGWVALMNIADPVITTYFYDVPIELINTSVIESIDKTFELTSEETVRVAIKDQRSIVDTLKKEDVSVIADLSKLSYVNAVPLNGFVEKYPSLEVVFLDGNTVNVELDSLISKEFDVIIESSTNTSNITRFVPDLQSDTETVIITGSKNKIDTIDKVVYTCNISDVKEDYRESVSPVIYDKNGSVVDKKYLKLNQDSIEIYGSSYNIKEVDVNISLSEDYISGYKVDNINYSPKTVQISGEDDLLKQIDSLNIVLDTNSEISNISNNQFVKMVSLSKHLQSGLYLVSKEEDLTVTINFEPLKTKEISFDSSDIIFANLNSAYTASIKDDTFSVIISGEDTELEKIVKENLLPFLDLSGLPEGNYNLILQFNGLDRVTVVSNLSVKLVIEKNN